MADASGIRILLAVRWFISDEGQAPTCMPTASESAVSLQWLLCHGNKLEQSGES